ncbi:unnamed protein product [Prunus brigantina]
MLKRTILAKSFYQRTRKFGRWVKRLLGMFRNWGA